MKNDNIYLLVVIVLLLSIIYFSIDFLSNKEITHSERKIGVLTFLHHIIFNTFGIIPLLLIIKVPFSVISFVTIGFILAQFKWIATKDHCLITEYINNLIDPEKKYYKWRATLECYIKHYIRGDEWAFSDTRIYDRDFSIILYNIILSFLLITYRP